VYEEWLNKSLTRWELSQKTISCGRNYLSIRQVAKRLKSLLPDRLSRICQQYEGSRVSKTRSLRLAYVDKNYLRYIDEYMAISVQAMKNRVELDVYTMFFQAKQSR